MTTLSPQEVQNALEQKQFIPFFQPIHDIRTGICVGAEVLARMQHLKAGILPPPTFLHHLQASGALSALTRELMAKVELWVADRTLPEGFMLTFNITPNMAAEPWLFRACQQLRMLADGKVTIVLELTEQAPLTDHRHRYRHRLQRLRQAGVKLALDDFGTGYAGLSLLHRIVSDFLKLPREFVACGTEQHTATCIIDSIVILTKMLGIKIIAEGVETREQLTRLSEKGIDYVQGFYHSPPLSRNDFSHYLSLDTCSCIERANVKI